MSHEFIDSKKLARRIEEVKEELAKLLHLESFLGSAPKKSGKRAGRPAMAAPNTAAKRGKRGNVKGTVLAYLEKNKQGKASEIAKASGLKVGSINQVLFALKKDGTVTQDKKHGSPFAISKK